MSRFCERQVHQLRDMMCFTLLENFGTPDRKFELPLLYVTTGTFLKRRGLVVERGIKFHSVYSVIHNTACLVYPDLTIPLAIQEYDEFADSPIIGSNTCNNEGYLLTCMAHELAHWYQAHVMQDEGDWKEMHGLKWQAAYSVLRQLYVNPHVENIGDIMAEASIAQQLLSLGESKQLKRLNH